MANNFTFIHVSDPATNPKPGKSQQIRSHCMQGKNKREGSRRSIREKRRREKEEREERQVVQPSMQPLTPMLSGDTLISDLALLRLAGPDIDAEAKGILFKALAYNLANHSLSPLDRAVDFDMLEHANFTWLFHDIAFLHSILTVSYAVSDLLAPTWDGKPSRKTLSHLRTTLRLLREKMTGNETVHEDESVLVVVINLALLSAVYGDWNAAATHFKGLQRIIELRGNLTFLLSRPKLHFKLDRIDLAYSLSSGKPPFFRHPSVSWNPTIPPPYLPLPEDLYVSREDWDGKLANVYQDFQYLALRINRNALRRARHNAACFQAVLTSLQSRLVHLDAQLPNPVQELVRLTMLAMLTTTFKAPGRKIPYGWVNERLREAWAEAFAGVRGHDVTLRVWVLVVAAFTVCGTDKVWIREGWRDTMGGRSWSWVMVKAQLMRVMWIELIHDRPGCAAFEELENALVAQ